MGTKDIQTKKFIGDVRVFTDVFNAILFKGERVIQPKNLKELDPSLILSRGQKRIERDLLKRAVIMTDGHFAYLLLGIECQSHLDWTMPLRCQRYDVEQYFKQLEEKIKGNKRAGNKLKNLSREEFLSNFKKGDKLLPVITLVIYFGATKWEGPRTLHDMLEIKDKRILPFVQNYSVNLIEPYAMSDKEIDRFESQFREVIRFLKYSRDKIKLRRVLRKESRFASLDYETAKVIETVVGLREGSIQFNITPDKKGKVNMCKALVEIAAEERAKGEVKGRTQGLTEGRTQTSLTYIKNLMKSMECSVDQAMNILAVPSAERAKYAKLLAKKK